MAIRYGLNQWTELGRFLEDACIPLDNNASERALRRVALGRKNFLFVGDADSGANIAGLYSLAATCEARGINPLVYLTDVLTRIGDHPANKLDELLQGRGPPLRLDARRRRPDGYLVTCAGEVVPPGCTTVENEKISNSANSIERYPL